MNRLIAILALVFTLMLIMAGPSLVLAQETSHEETAAEHGEAVEGHGEAGGHGGGELVSSEKFYDFIKRTVAFLVLFGALFYVLRKPAGNFFRGRREEIANSLDEFEKKKAEAESKFAELEGKLSEISAERERLIEEYKRDGEEEREKIIANAKDMAERIKKQAQMTIDVEIKAAKAELIREIADMSAAMAEEVVRKNINEDDQVRLVEEYLEKVVQN